MSALDITGAGLIRALRAAARPVIDRAVRERAKTITAEADNAALIRRGEGDFEVVMPRTDNVDDLRI